MRYSLVLIAMYLLVITGCSTSHAVRTSADPDQDQAMLGEIAKLVGPWEMSDEEGKKHLTATFAVTAGGSAVREIMFPGDAHEMTNLYHMDGTSLVLTHYCAAGNQPRMVASSVRETDSGTVFHFDIDSVSNLRESHDHYMGNMTLTILKDGGLLQEWRSYQRDGKLSDPAIFKLSRIPGPPPPN